MDLDSMVRCYWVREFSAKGDGFPAGTYLYRAHDTVNGDGSVTPGKQYRGSVWDFDHAYALSCYGETESRIQLKDWFPVLLKVETLKKALKESWLEYTRRYGK